MTASYVTIAGWCIGHRLSGLGPWSTSQQESLVYCADLTRPEVSRCTTQFVAGLDHQDRVVAS